MSIRGHRKDYFTINAATVLANSQDYDVYIHKITTDTNSIEDVKCATFYVINNRTGLTYFMNVENKDTINKIFKLSKYHKSIIDATFEVDDDTFKPFTRADNINETADAVIDTILKNKLIKWLMNVSIIKYYEYTKDKYPVSEYNNISLVFKLKANKDSDELRYLIKDALIRDLTLHEKVYEVNCNNSLNKNTEHVMNISIVI